MPIHVGGLLGAKYTMLADLYEQVKEYNDAGQIVRSWDYENPRTIENRTMGILGGGIRVVGSTETWGEDYEPVEWAKMYIPSQQMRDVEGEEVYITRRFRIGNIIDAQSKKKLWVGDDGDSIEFNIMGITPIADPFGVPMEYELLLKGETGD